MPLTPKGKKIMKGFKSIYGKRAKGVFHAYMKKHPERVRLWHK